MATTLRNTTRHQITLKLANGDTVFIQPQQLWIDERKVSQLSLPQGLVVMSSDKDSDNNSDNK